MPIYGFLWVFFASQNTEFLLACNFPKPSLDCSGTLDKENLEKTFVLTQNLAHPKKLFILTQSLSHSKKILYSPKRFQKYLLEQKSQKRILTFTQKKSYLWKEKVFLPVLMKKTAANQNKITSPSLHLLSSFIFPYFTILFYIIS